MQKTGTKIQKNEERRVKGEGGDLWLGERING